MKPLEGKNILVTGGSRGIGAALVKVLADKGAKVAFTYNSNQTSAEQLLGMLPGNGHKAVMMNISDQDSVEKSFEEVVSHFGGVLDGVVNNAGITKDQLLLRMKAEDFQTVIDTNLKGTFLVTKAALKPMLKSRKGSIVSITSIIGQMGNPGQSNYAASKAGIEAFMKSTAYEVASRGIRANCVAPGFIETDMTHALNEEQKKGILSRIPLERIAAPEEVAYAVAFLLSDESRYVTGHTLSVNGGMRMG